MAVIYTGTSLFKRLISIFAIPVLGVLSIGLFLCTVIVIVGGLLYTFGAEIRMEIFPDLSVPQYLGLPVGIIFGLLLLAIAFFSWRVLKYFLNDWNK
ncbi:hypothetical protein [Paraliobacillus sp. JSM ZJ581]|uniref:hypothetical protein n=1 Tax=Paraliobacillus sp. JSM ZJ581 TaxID=3342118 RepID=UPI0035A91AC6